MSEVNTYAYAKACGIIGKSFIGKRMSSIMALHSLSDLDRLVFPDYYHTLPSVHLLPDLQNRITIRAVNKILSIVDSYTNPPQLIEQMLRTYEYDDFKKCIHLIAAGKKDLPPICDIGRFRTINFKAFPDLTKMLKNTDLEFLLDGELRQITPYSDIAVIENKIDDFFYKGLVESLYKLSDEDRWVLQRFLADEISLRNCTYALRLRTFYEKSEEDIEKFLIDIRIHGKKKGSLTTEAIQSLDYPLNSRYQWENWKWEELLNPEEGALHWTADPRHFQNAAALYLYRLAMRFFRLTPMALSAIFCFIKLIQFEEDLLISVAEGLALGMDSADIFSLLEVTK